MLAATGGRGADVIYDGLGGAAHAENLRALAPLGHWILHGQAGGPHAALDPRALGAKSATLSCPVLFHYTASRERYEAMAARTFEACRRTILRRAIDHRYPLSAAADAHRDLEGRRTTGQLVLVPSAGSATPACAMPFAYYDKLPARPQAHLPRERRDRARSTRRRASRPATRRRDRRRARRRRPRRPASAPASG